MRFFAVALIFFGVAASYAQSPEVPHKIHFAGMVLTIRDDAKREIQKDVDALVKSPRYYNMKVERARTYFPIIEKIFKEEELPEDFKYLALQESSLVPDAVSPSNAVGFWQFKDFTAQEMGMRVDKEVDERMNIVSSSRGAAKYIKQNNWYFNNWVLALQAYQQGKGGVKEMLGEKYNGDTHMEINSETYWYVKKFLAHKIAFEKACEEAPQLKVSLYETKSKKDINDIASEFSIEQNILQEYNKWLKTGVVPDDKPYAVAIPGGNVPKEFNSLWMKSPEITAVKAADVKGKPNTDTKFHINGILVIKANAGETVSALAQRSKVDISKFLEFNEISIDERIRPGVYYFLKKKRKKSATNAYQSKAGDDLWLISQQQGVRLSSLKKFNPGLNENGLKAGTIVRLNNSKTVDQISGPIEDVEVAELGNEAFSWAVQPIQSKQEQVKIESNSLEKNEIVDTKPMAVDSAVVKQKQSATDSSFLYEVKASDTLYGIARQFGATIKEVMDWNNKSTLTLTPGEKLRILKR
ncbi:MAG TPA: hypothetical protein DGG95_08255 [Cytophagales bacterium]|jgi:membrane-bound lytic murein transglycosylase D|nr:hypothetical protein [Cytophagales bacterium]